MNKKMIVGLVTLTLVVSVAAMALTPSKFRTITKDQKGNDVGNCIFVTTDADMSKESSFTPVTEITCGKFEKINAVCYFPKKVSEYNPTGYQIFGSLHSTGSGIGNVQNLKLTPERLNSDYFVFTVYDKDPSSKPLWDGEKVKALDSFCSTNTGGEKDRLVTSMRVLNNKSEMAGLNTKDEHQFTLTTENTLTIYTGGGNDSGKKGGGLKKLFGK